MAVYNKAGIVAQIIYVMSGNLLSDAYYLDGVQVFPDGPQTLKVMSYNVQYFKKINSQQTMLTEIANKYNADIIGLQELASYSLSTIPVAGQVFLTNYPNRNLSGHINKLMLATKSIVLSNVVYADFINQDPEDMTQYNETRAYIKGEFSVGGKTITIINTHLCLLTTSVKWQQMEEIFALAEQCEYVIITGDFNQYSNDASGDDFVHMFKPFLDAGYNLANCSPDFGFIKTASNLTTAETLDDLQAPPDNIIVSGNINIVDAIVDDTKLSYLDGNPIDHVPIIAVLEIQR